MARRFNLGQRIALYLAAGGMCQGPGCGRRLERGWHADHRIPVSRGGRTEISNGQALCPQCNLVKGDSMPDKIVLRDKQQEIADRVLERALEWEPGRTVVPVVALLAPGFGKELGWMNAAVVLQRHGLIDAVFDLTPRRTLCEQAELNWYSEDKKGRPNPESWRLQYAEPVPHSYQWTDGNATPLWRPPQFGYITTYAALKRLDLHLGDSNRPGEAWKHSGRFLLVCDEAAALGGLPARADSEERDEDEREGTLAGQAIRLMSEHARVVLYLTGAPDRGDGRMLINCESRYRPVTTNGRTRYFLEPDVEATYREGVGLGILRPPEAYYFNAMGDEVLDPETGSTKPLSVQDSSRWVSYALEDERVWKPMVDAVLFHLRGLRNLTDKRYQAGIACMDQAHADKIEEYVKECAPAFEIAIALSRDNKASQVALQGARDGKVDVLVFVRQAFIGFNCPPMAVMGLLTHYRDESHLIQLCGRALRWWKDGGSEQIAKFVTLNDPDSHRFFERLKEDARLGLRERGDGHSGGGGGARKETRNWRIGSAEVEDADGEVPDADKLLRLAEELGIYGSARKMAEFAARSREECSEKSNGESDDFEGAQTGEAHLDAYVSATATNVGRIAWKWWKRGRYPDLGRATKAVNDRIGGEAGWAARNGERRNPEIIRRRYELSVTMCREADREPELVV